MVESTSAGRQHAIKIEGMNKDLVLTDWQLNAGAPAGTIRDAASSLSYSLPADYVQFLLEHNGGEGFIGDNYLILWKVEELDPFNREYEVGQYAPGLLLFGSSGGGEAYGFDTREIAMPVVRVPFIGMELRYVRSVASSFTDLLIKLAK